MLAVVFTGVEEALMRCTMTWRDRTIKRYFGYEIEANPEEEAVARRVWSANAVSLRVVRSRATLRNEIFQAERYVSLASFLTALLECTGHHHVPRVCRHLLRAHELRHDEGASFHLQSRLRI